MKKTSISIIVLMATITIAMAQKLKPNSVIRAKRISYKTDSLRSGNMIVHNEKNIYHNPDKKPNNPEVGDNLKLPKARVIAIFKKVFSNERLQQLLVEGSIGLEYVVADDGKILEVSFWLNKNTAITAAELEELEDAFKNDATFKWIVPHKNTEGYYKLSQIIRFSKILDGTMGG